MDLKNEDKIKSIQKGNFSFNCNLILILNYLFNYADVMKEKYDQIDPNKLAIIAQLLEEIHKNVQERTLELIFFKYSIGDSCIKKILCELYSSS